jgi:release factor glutamine methyltransferase
MDIGGQLRAAKDRLTQAGCDSPRLDAELLLAHALGLGRAQLYARWEHRLSDEQQRVYLGLVQRRVQREPLAYVVGHKEFFGLEFEVDRNVLIPRPETELLVEQAIRIAHQITPDGDLKIADVGTGSGAIAVSLAVSLPDATVDAVDRSVEALAVAARNCRRHGVDSRVRLLRGHLLLALPEPVDIVVANLPYIGRSEFAIIAPEIRLFEPAEALDGGEEGLDLIRWLLEQAVRQPKPPRVILLEIGSTQGEAVLDMAGKIFVGAEMLLFQDYAGLDRIVTVKS